MTNRRAASLILAASLSWAGAQCAFAAADPAPVIFTNLAGESCSLSPRDDVTRMEVFDCVVADTDALHQFGAILTRVAHCLERAGKSY